AIPYSFYEHNASFTKHTFWLNNDITNDEKLIITKQNGIAIDSSVVDFLTLKDFKDTVLNIKDNVASSFDLNQQILLQPTFPLKEFVKEKIKLIEGNKLVESVIEQDTNSLNIKIKYAFKENTNYQLKIDSGAF